MQSITPWIAFPAVISLIEHDVNTVQLTTVILKAFAVGDKLMVPIIMKLSPKT